MGFSLHDRDRDLRGFTRELASASLAGSVFLGCEFWTHTRPIYPLLAQLAQGHEYARYLRITDSPEEAVQALEDYARNHARLDAPG